MLHHFFPLAHAPCHDPSDHVGGLYPDLGHGHHGDLGHADGPYLYPYPCPYLGFGFSSGFSSAPWRRYR
jgi:hypothetical protein